MQRRQRRTEPRHTILSTAFTSWCHNHPGWRSATPWLLSQPWGEEAEVLGVVDSLEFKMSAWFYIKVIMCKLVYLDLLYCVGRLTHILSVSIRSVICLHISLHFSCLLTIIVITSGKRHLQYVQTQSRTASRWTFSYSSTKHGSYSSRAHLCVISRSETRILNWILVFSDKELTCFFSHRIYLNQSPAVLFWSSPHTSSLCEIYLPPWSAAKRRTSKIAE